VDKQPLNPRRTKRTLPAVLLVVFVVVSSLVTFIILSEDQRRVEAKALRPIADRLGTEPSKVAILVHVGEMLQSCKGSSRAEIHQLLDSLGGEFTYRGPYETGNAQTVENAYWVLAELPRYKTWTVWILRYDSSDRLTDAELGDSP